MSKSKRSKAVALKYNAEEDMAPLVVASGYGDVADRIIDVAEQRGIPVFRDDSAASMMCMLQVGTTIPEELYQVVAAIYVQLLSIASDIKNPGNGMAYAPIQPEAQMTQQSSSEAQTVVYPTELSEEKPDDLL